MQSTIRNAVNNEKVTNNVTGCFPTALNVIILNAIALNKYPDMTYDVRCSSCL